MRFSINYFISLENDNICIFYSKLLPSLTIHSLKKHKNANFHLCPLLPLEWDNIATNKWCYAVLLIKVHQAVNCEENLWLCVSKIKPIVHEHVPHTCVSVLAC